MKKLLKLVFWILVVALLTWLFMTLLGAWNKYEDGLDKEADKEA